MDLSFIKDIFSFKEKLWVGRDLDLYERNCAVLKAAGIRAESFTVNQANPKCFGHCDACAGCSAQGETSNYLSDVLSGTDITGGYPGSAEIYTIYVKSSDLARAKELINPSND